MATHMSEREIRKIERDRKKEEDRLKRENEKQRLQKEEKRTREQIKRDKKEREQIELQKQRERLLQERRKLKEKSKLISEMEKRMKERGRIETENRQKSNDSDKDFESDSSETDDEFKELEPVESDSNSSKERNERRDKSKTKEKRKNANRENISLNRSECKQRRRRERQDSSESEHSDLDKSVEVQTNVRESFSEERLKDNKGSVQDIKDEVSFGEDKPLSNDSLGDIDRERELETEQSESDLSEISYTTVEQIHDGDYFDNPRHNSTGIETGENNNVKFEDEMRWLDDKWQQYESENAELKSNIDKLRNTDIEKENTTRDRDKHMKYTEAEEMLKEKIKRLKIREKKVNNAIQENRILKQRQAEELEKLKLRQTESKRESDKRRMEKDKLKKLKDEEMLLKQRIKEKETRLLNENRTNTEKNENKENSRKANMNEKIESTKGKLHKPNIPSLTETTFEEWKIEVEIILNLREWNHLVLQDGVVYRRGQLNDQEYLQLVLPTHLREEIFLALHDDLGHQGRDRTTSLFKQRFYWPGMDSWIEERVRQCDRCTKRKTFPSIAPLVNFSSSSPMEILCIDFLSLEKSKGGHEHVLVLTDHFTRYSQAYPTKNQTAKTTARVLFDQFIVHYGFPARIHSDQGANFESSLIKELCQLAGIAKSHTTPYHPMGNPVERFNSTLLKMLGTLENNIKSDWKSYIAPLVHAYNVTIHPSTGFSPYFLMFGRHPKLAIDALLGFPSQNFNRQNQHEYINKLKTKLAAAYKKAEETSKQAAAKNKERYDIKAKANRLKPGDLVLVRNVNIRGKHKLADKWEDTPYIVVSQPNDDLPVYEILKDCRKAKKTRVLHRNHLLPLGMKHKAYESISSSTSNAQESDDTNLVDTGDSSEESE